MARKSQGVLSISTVAGLILFFSSAAVGSFHVYNLKPLTVLPYALAVAVPFLTYLSFLLVSALVPALYSVGRFRFPITITLPIIFSLLMMVSATLWSSTGNSLVRPHPAMDIVAIWFSPTVVGLTVVLQAVVLTLVGKLQK